jgi:hypothetical protein
MRQIIPKGKREFRARHMTGRAGATVGNLFDRDPWGGFTGRWSNLAYRSLA